MKNYLKNLCIRDCILSLITKNVIYGLQLGFRQQYSTSHVLIYITENIRKALDDGNIGCGIFVDLQKAFDTVDHQITMKLVEFQMIGLSRISLIAISMYLKNGYESGLAAINCGVTQGSVLGPLLFLLDTNDLNLGM